ncbi:hypothetical protein RFI_24458, partial [Reticulomyxa filosa]
MSQGELSSWLAANKLSSVERTFQERTVTLEELLEFEVDELVDFAKDMKLDTLSTRRLMKGIEEEKKRRSDASQTQEGSSTWKGQEITKYGEGVPQVNVDDDSIIPGASEQLKGLVRGKDDQIRIIVTVHEQEAFNKLQGRQQECETLMEKIALSIEELTRETLLKQTIQDTLESVILTLKEKEQQVQFEVVQKQKQKELLLKSQLQILSNHQNTLAL